MSAGRTGELPFTGGQLADPAKAGLIAVLLGSSLLVAARRPRESVRSKA